MKKVETLLNIELGQKFDTPKKLNRSANIVPAEIVESLEGGIFTAEMIEALKTNFPIFHYRTCITIHGNWPETSVRSVGMYKNIHQNKNGSLEVFYSAIDRQKIATIRENLKQVASDWRFIENSTDRVFRIDQPVNKDNVNELKPKYLAIAERVKLANIYGYVNVYIQPTLWGGYYIVCDIHPLAIPESEIIDFCYRLTDLTAETWSNKAKEVTRINSIKATEDKAASEAAEAERQKRREAQIELLNKEYKPQIAHLKDGTIQQGTIVKLTEKWNSDTTQYSGFTFNYFRIDGKGSFGKTKWSKATSEVFTSDLTTLEFLPQTERKLNELKHTGKLVIVTPTPIKKEPVKEVPAEAITGVTLVQYSDKAIAIFGNTKTIKDTLKKLGGRFNPFLNNNGTKQAGWIFPATKRNELTKYIS